MDPLLRRCNRVSVEPTEEQQVGNLLHDLQRVRDAAGPERVPDAVNLVLIPPVII